MKNNSHEIILKCNLAPESVFPREIPSSRQALSQEQLTQVETTWTKYLTESEKVGRKVWNGTLYQFEGHCMLERGVGVFMSTISAKEAIAFRLLGGKEKHEEPIWARNMFVCAVLRSADGKYLFGEPSGTTTATRAVDLLGGALSKDEFVINKGEDLAQALTKEFDQEMNLYSTKVANIRLRGIISTKASSVGLVFQAALLQSAQKTVQKFQEENDGELKGIRIVEADKLISFLKKSQGYLPLISEILT